MEFELIISAGQLISAVISGSLGFLLPHYQKKLQEMSLIPKHHPVVGKIAALESTIKIFEGQNKFKTAVIKQWHLDTTEFLAKIVIGTVHDWHRLKRHQKARFVATMHEELASTFNAYQEYMEVAYPPLVYVKFTQITAYGRDRMLADFQYILSKKEWTPKKMVWEIFNAIELYVDYVPKFMIVQNQVNGALKGIEFNGFKNE